MAVYGNEVVNESTFFLSSDGKELKKSLKDEFKAFDTKGLGKRIKASFKVRYDEKARNECIKILKKKVNIIYDSDVYKVVTTDQNGGSYVNYVEDFFGYYKDNFYKLSLDYYASGCRIYQVDELIFTSAIITKEIIKDTFDIFGGKGYLMYFKKDKITFQNISANNFTKKGPGSPFEALVDRINSKYNDVEASIGKLGYTIKLKRK